MSQSLLLSTYYPPANQSPYYPSIYPPIHPSFHPSIIHLPLYPYLFMVPLFTFLYIKVSYLSKYSYLYLCFNLPTCPATFLPIDLSIYLVQFSARNLLYNTARTINYISCTTQNRAMSVTVVLPYTKMREQCDKSNGSNCCTGISSQVTRGQTDRHTHITFLYTYI